MQRQLIIQLETIYQTCREIHSLSLPIEQQYKAIFSNEISYIILEELGKHQKNEQKNINNDNTNEYELIALLNNINFYNSKDIIQEKTSKEKENDISQFLFLLENQIKILNIHQT